MWPPLKLLGIWYVLEFSLRNFYDQYDGLFKQYKVPFSRMLNHIMEYGNIQWRYLLPDFTLL